MNKLRGFPPIADQDARLLILGSMPGAASLKASEYYAHPRNSFWRIITTLFDSPSDLAYDDRAKLLITHGIALWDVLAVCIRPGSLDSAIAPGSCVTNNFAAFFQTHPHIIRIYFNGQTAESLFKRQVKPTLAEPDNLTCQRLPSTSPANARMAFNAKLNYWRIIAE